MTDGEFGPTYAEIRNLNNLDSTEIADSVIDQHLEEAYNDVQNALKITFATAAITLTNYEINSRDIDHNSVYQKKLYLRDCKDSSGRHINPVVSLTSVEYRDYDNLTYETLTSGQGDDYVM